MTTKTSAAKIRPRGSADVQAVIAQLRKHPGDWIEYSTHTTRGAARQRVHALRAGANFRGLPVEWATRRDVPGDIYSAVRVYVRWLPDAPTDVVAGDTPDAAS